MNTRCDHEGVPMLAHGVTPMCLRCHGEAWSRGRESTEETIVSLREQLAVMRTRWVGAMRTLMEAHRAAKRWAEADKVRDELRAAGVVVGSGSVASRP